MRNKLLKLILRPYLKQHKKELRAYISSIWHSKTLWVKYRNPYQSVQALSLTLKKRGSNNFLLRLPHRPHLLHLLIFNSIPSMVRWLLSEVSSMVLTLPHQALAWPIALTARQIWSQERTIPSTKLWRTSPFTVYWRVWIQVLVCCIISEISDQLA